jgi:cytochrome P450 / NADPH-cytochrome P450 reductase
MHGHHLATANVLAFVLKQFNIELVNPPYDLRIEQTLTIKPEGLQMRMRPMSILFGSKSGSCESFAGTLASEAPLYGYNAKQFVAYLDSRPTLDLTYAVFDANHHDWVNTYQKIPIFIDKTLASCGGRRLIERRARDAADDF